MEEQQGGRRPCGEVVRRALRGRSWATLGGDDADVTAGAVQPAVALAVDPLDASISAVVTTELSALVAHHAAGCVGLHLGDQLRRDRGAHLGQQSQNPGSLRGREAVWQEHDGGCGVHLVGHGAFPL